MYESYAADRDWAVEYDRASVFERGGVAFTDALGLYANRAHRLAEELEWEAY